MNAISNHNFFSFNDWEKGQVMSSMQLGMYIPRKYIFVYVHICFSRFRLFFLEFWFQVACGLFFTLLFYLNPSMEGILLFMLVLSVLFCAKPLCIYLFISRLPIFVVLKMMEAFGVVG